MDDSKPAETTNAAPTSSSDALSRRVDAILLKLLDAIERDVDSGVTDHLGAYEKLCRAEAMRLCPELAFGVS